MQQSFYRIFVKNIFIFIMAMFVFLCAKTTSAYILYANTQKYEQLDILVRQCIGYNIEELETYAEQIIQPNDSGLLRADKASLTAFATSMSNYKQVHQIISFAKNKEGKLPLTLPENYLDRLDFFAKLSEPSVINEQPLDIYWGLQSSSIIAVISLFLGSVIWGSHYESGISRYAKTTLHGKHYVRGIRIILLLISLTFLIINELADIYISKIGLQYPIWSVTVQSYSPFKYSQINCTFGELYIIILISKCCNIIFLSHLAEIIAKNRHEIKDSVIIATIFIIGFLFMGKALLNTSLFPLLQAGSVNWSKIIEKTILFRPGDTPSIILGIVINVLAAISISLIVHKKTPV